MGIGQAAERLGVTPMALRVYERRGIVLPARTPTGRRLFSVHELEILRCARTLVIEEGLNLEGVRHLLGQIRCWQVRRCSPEDRAACPVTLRPSGPCWSLPGTPCRERAEDCRACAVYRELPGCRTIKARLHAGAGKGAVHPGREPRAGARRARGRDNHQEEGRP